MASMRSIDWQAEIKSCQYRYMLTIRPARENDRDAIWPILEAVIRAGETYPLPRDMSKDESLSYWFSGGHEVFVAEDGSSIVGTYFLQPNQKGGGSHVANCGYMSLPSVRGRGVGSAMCAHSLEQARSRGFKAMQFNFVVSTNDGAVRLWKKNGFQIAGTLPKVFLHPEMGYVDAYVMYREL